VRRRARLVHDQARVALHGPHERGRGAAVVRRVAPDGRHGGLVHVVGVNAGDAVHLRARSRPLALRRGTAGARSGRPVPCCAWGCYGRRSHCAGAEVEGALHRLKLSRTLWPEL